MILNFFFVLTGNWFDFISTKKVHKRHKILWKKISLNPTLKGAKIKAAHRKRYSRDCCEFEVTFTFVFLEKVRKIQEECRTQGISWLDVVKVV